MIPTKYVESGSMSQAIDETFSGDYPCKMCELAARKRVAEQNPLSPTAPSSEKKSDKSQKLIIFSKKMICIYPPKLDGFPRSGDTFELSSLASSPETPPPDSSLV